MSKKSLLIIGSGISGLSTGTYAQRAGYKSIIFEKHYHAGGLATYWKRKDYLIDGGIFFLTSCNPKLKSFQVLRDLGVDDPNLYIPMTNYANYIDETTGTKISVGQDLDRLERDLKKLAPQDKAIIEEIIKAIKTLKGADIDHVGMTRPLELSTTFSKLRMMWEGRQLISIMRNKKYTESISKFAEGIKSESLRNLFTHIFYSNSPTWLIFRLISSMASGGMSLIKGGCKSFVSKIEDNYKSLGGQVRYNSKVTKILTENNKACGIQLANGEQIKGDCVISASDTDNTIYNLLEGKYTNESIDKIQKTWTPAEPYMLVTYGVNKDLQGESPINMLHLKKPVDCGDKETTDFLFRVMNYGDFAPKGKGIIQALFHGNWNYWEQMSKNKAQYVEAKKRLADEVLDRLNAHFPGIKDNVEVTDVATPVTMHKFTLSKQGSAGGWGTTTEHMATKRYRTLPGLKNFYMAGQWAFSGGVIPVIYSGKHAIDLVKHNL